MKQPDTAALRERLANYTPEDELEQDKQELEGLSIPSNGSGQLLMPWLRQRTVRTIS